MHLSLHIRRGPNLKLNICVLFQFQSLCDTSNFSAIIIKHSTQTGKKAQLWLIMYLIYNLFTIDTSHGISEACKITFFENQMIVFDVKKLLELCDEVIILNVHFNTRYVLIEGLLIIQISNYIIFVMK